MMEQAVLVVEDGNYVFACEISVFICKEIACL
jgi:hypothetical protein